MDSGIDEAWPIVLRAHPASSFAAGTPITWVLPMCDDPTRHMIRSGKTVTATLPWVHLQYSPGDGVAHAGRESLPPAISYHDLRHTAASLLVALVANVMRVRRQRGYADQSIILDNQLHLFDTGLGETGRKMGEILTTWRNECGKQNTP